MTFLSSFDSNSTFLSSNLINSCSLETTLNLWTFGSSFSQNALVKWEKFHLGIVCPFFWLKFLFLIRFSFSFHVLLSHPTSLKMPKQNALDLWNALLTSFDMVASLISCAPASTPTSLCLTNLYGQSLRALAHLA